MKIKQNKLIKYLSLAIYILKFFFKPNVTFIRILNIIHVEENIFHKIRVDSLRNQNYLPRREEITVGLCKICPRSHRVIKF